MNLPEDKKRHDLRLRASAERQIDNAPRDEPRARPAEELLHELQVHQVELEMQNEALRQAQIALAESRDRYVDLYEFAPVGYLTLDADGMIEEINLTGATLLGREREKLLQRGFTSLVIAEDQDRWIRHFLNVKQGDGKGSVELALRRGDGTAFDAQLDCMRTAESPLGVRPEGEAALRNRSASTMRIALSDITKYKRMQAELLLQSQDELQLAQRIAHVGSWKLDVASNRVVWSEELYRMLGLSPASPPPDYTEQQKLFTPESWARLSSALPRTVESGVPYELELETLKPDGSHGWMLARGEAVRDEAGAIVAVRGVAMDITERKQAEAARAHLEAQLRESQKMEALGSLAGGIAHDFNNALAAISGNAELARQDVGLGHIALESLEEINKAARRARDLVQQILAFGRRQPLERKPTTLSLVVLESARLARATLPAGVTLKVECKSDAPAVLADASHIKQILLNLCGNAIQAVQDQGCPGVVEVRLEVHAQDEARGELKPGRYACLTVQDNGPGMDEATRARIFEPFFTTKPRGKGTGLGLPVVHGIVKAHEASIEVASTPGEGSAFHIYFPAVDAPIAVVAAPASDTPPVSGRGKHILYIDDEEAIVFLMQRLLERQGYRVSGFTNPEEALAAARADPALFDLVVTDYNMPGMLGLEVAEALREIRADLPVIMASGYITEELRAKAPAAGIRELIYKPNTVDDLCEAVARFANGPSANNSPS
jgi:PAS domain S-box-containing protein